MEAAGLRPDGPPPRGSYVFYDCSGELKGETRNWGHIGLSLGDGQVIHAWDVVRIDPIQGVEALDPPPGWPRPVYTGWAPPEVLLLGVREKE